MGKRTPFVLGTRLLVVGLCGVAFGLACARVAVETTAAPGTDVSLHSTFAQVEPPWPHPVVGEHIERAIANELHKKGYRAAPRGEAELVVTFGARAEERSRTVNQADPDVDVYRVESYLAGTVEINVFDRLERSLLWEGVGQVDLRKEEDAPRAATRAVQAILARFPAASARD